jgi:hypothetical protein
MTSILLFLTFLVTACGGEKSSSKSVQAVQTNTQNEVLTDGKLITQYSEKEIVQCALEDIENNAVTPLNRYSTRLGRRIKSKLHVQLPASLTRKITADLQSKTKQRKLTPSMFWSTLSEKLEKQLTKILINIDVNRSEEDYRRLQQEIAFAFTVYLENPTGDHGYRLLSKRDNGKTKMTAIAFTQKTTSVRVVRPCEKFRMGEIFIPEQLRSPRNITAKILCKNSKGEKLSISGSIDNQYNEELWINLVSQNLGDNFKLIKNKVNIIEDRRKSRSLFYEGNEIYNYKYVLFDIKKIYSSKPDSIKELDFTAYTNGGRLIKVKDLKCKTVKELTFN